MKNFNEFLDENNIFLNEAKTDSDKKDTTKKEIKILEDTAKYSVITPTTQAAAIYWGQNTKWDISRKNNNKFDEYQNEGSFYMIIEKPSSNNENQDVDVVNKKYLISFTKKLFIDNNNIAIDIKELAEILEELPKFKNLFTKAYLKKGFII